MYFRIKRTFDLCVTILAMPMWLPLVAAISLVVKLTSSGPIFFTQQRFGKNQKLFTIYKFRTMYVNAPCDVPTHLLENPGAYITSIGRFLRKTSLDELPQLFNILRGDISLVGPRPALHNQDTLMRLRAENGSDRVPVGITGLAQIFGRDEIPERLKARLDGLYARKVGLRLDLWILIKTVGKVISASGIAEGRQR